MIRLLVAPTPIKQKLLQENNTFSGIVFQEIEITWRTGFDDVTDIEAFQKARLYEVNWAIFETAIGKMVLAKGYTKAVVRTGENGLINARFIKESMRN